MNDRHLFFDAEFYRGQLPDGDAAVEDPLDHYLREGASLGLDPHPLFWTDYYAERFASLVGERHPYEHFLDDGWQLGCDPNPFFATAWYREANPDVAAGGLNPVIHYATFGGFELGRSPHPNFYARAYADRRHLAPGANPLVDFVGRYRRLVARTASARPPVDPDVSIVILNLNKSLLTLQSVVEVFESRDAGVVEIVVVDNGSAGFELEWLARMLPGNVRLVRVGINRFFGEGNNIGACASFGRHVLFLNNDAFLEADTLHRLCSALERHPDAGAVGAKLLYADGRIQEAGGFISACGTVTQRGKGLFNSRGRFEQTEPVDYVSAACVLVPRRYLDAIAGFDHVFEPAYYEDVDLCLRLRLLHLKTYYCGTAQVVHLENTTASDQSLGLGLNTVVEVNREKFINRWASYLESKTLDAVGARLATPASRAVRSNELPLALLATPYHLVAGGGERYILSLAQTLSRTHRTVIVTPEPYSAYRLSQLGAELALDLSRVELASEAETTKLGPVDLYIAIGNQALPQQRAVGRRNVYICQFPFPMNADYVAHAWGALDGYDAVVVYSDFAARCFSQRASRLVRALPPILIIPPPVPHYAPSPLERRSGRILSVGRFTSEGHCKRQDTLVQAFRELVETTGRPDLELHLAGTVPPDPISRDYFNHVRLLARGLDVTFHPNAGPEQLQALYESSAYYWHATGFGRDERVQPELLEHFGITIVEAMSCGAIPLVYGAGGPRAIVADALCGYHWRTVRDLVDRQRMLLDDGALGDRLRSRAIETADRYSRERFDARVAALLVPEGDVVAG